MSNEPHSIRSADLLAGGFVSRPDAVAEIRELLGDPRSGPRGRAYRITTACGISVEVLPERGLDLGSLWFASYPIAWRSPLESRGAFTDPAGEGWIGKFSGGMLATAGLDNIGPGHDGMGLHGSHHNTAATDVAIRRTADAGVVIEGVVDSARAFGRKVYLYRRIAIAADRAELTLTDRIVNEGTTAEGVPVLYHMNFGAPLVLPGTEIDVAAANHEPRDVAAQRFTWEHFPQPIEEVMESVWGHTGLERDAAGKAYARVHSAQLGITATVSWNADELPRCLEWIYPTRNAWALGIEPTNAPAWGPERVGIPAGAPVLEPGESINTGFTLAFSQD
jgi:hypothetical protein